MNGGYLVPANAKRGTLILNIFRPFDLIMFASGVAVSMLLLAIFPGSDIFWVIIFCLPAAVTGLLVVPIPSYHNVLCALQSIFGFYNSRRKYIWRGWCFYEQFKDNEKSK